MNMEDYPKAARPLCAPHRCALVNCKLVGSDQGSEEGRNTKIGTAEHEHIPRQVGAGKPS